jgi:hypothetical protein
LEDYQGQIAAKSPCWHRSFIKQEKSIVETNKRHEKALKDLENTIIFLEKITR